MKRTDYNILRRIVRVLKQGLWFRPLLWILGVLALAALVYIAGPALPVLPEVKPETAQGALELLASSMLTVTTVSFSMVLVVMTFISGQLSPRSIPGVLRDDAIQDALGVFLAGLVYGLVGMLAFEAIAALPNGPVLTMLLTALVCGITVVFLVRLIHHVSRRVQVSYILAQQRDLAEEAIESFFTVAAPGQAAGPAATGLPEAEPDRLRAPHSGYLQVLNLQDVFDIAVQEDLLVRVRHREGEYVGRDWPVFDLWPAGRASAEVSAALLGTAQVGESRTPEGDPLFPLEVMGEIGERALSPGVNDTGTALAALDHLSDSLLRWASYRERSPWLADGDGRLRIAIDPPSLATALERTAARILRCGSGNPEVERKVLWLLEQQPLKDCPDPMARAMIEQMRHRAGSRIGPPAPRAGGIAASG